jgi:hypothetical protein
MQEILKLTGPGFLESDRRIKIEAMRLAYRKSEKNIETRDEDDYGEWLAEIENRYSPRPPDLMLPTATTSPDRTKSTTGEAEIDGLKKKWTVPPLDSTVPVPRFLRSGPPLPQLPPGS